MGRTLYLRPESMAALAAWREVAPVDDDVFHAVDYDMYLDPRPSLTPPTSLAGRRAGPARTAAQRRR